MGLDPTSIITVVGGGRRRVARPMLADWARFAAAWSAFAGALALGLLLWGPR